VGAPWARHHCSSGQTGISKLRRSGIFWMRFPKMSRLTALGWLVFYNYKDAAPTALRLSAGNFVRRDTRLWAAPPSSSLRLCRRLLTWSLSHGRVAQIRRVENPTRNRTRARSRPRFIGYFARTRTTSFEVSTVTSPFSATRPYVGCYQLGRALDPV
jgi:hypothetical protein